MKNGKNIGIVVTVLGLLLTCCLCPLAMNSLVSFGRVRGDLYEQIFRNLRTATYIAGAQAVCAGVLALIVLIIGIVVLVQARGNGSAQSSTPPQ
jgi:hypothetical protein